MNTPVLIVAFNRPETLATLFQTLAEYRVSNLYFAVDGPRDQRPDDLTRVEEVKALIHKFFQPAPERCLFQTSNLGIRRGPPTAISWFFSQVEEGIILEDDCVPGPSFFPFVQWALEAYREDPVVKLVSGFNRFSPLDWPESHRFVKTAMIWGWASWRRAWTHYDPEMLSWDNPSAQRAFRRWVGAFPVFDHWRVAIEWVRSGRLVTWDVAWCWTVFQANGLAVMPRVNLIQNIGFGPDSTNTQGGDARARVLPQELSPPYDKAQKALPDLAFQRRLDRAEFWRTDDTWEGRLRKLVRAVRRQLVARQS